MTSSRVNLRVPPRLIESARAAQYANRETFGARTAQERIAREVNRRVEAEQRAAPGRDPQRGGLVDYGKRRMPRPARIRRRVRLPVDVGMGWVINENPSLPDYPESGPPGVSEDVLLYEGYFRPEPGSPEYDQIYPPLTPIGGTGYPVERGLRTLVRWTYRIHVGSGDGSTWRSIPFEITMENRDDKRYVLRSSYNPGGTIFIRRGFTDIHAESAAWDARYLPLSDGRIAYVLSLSKQSGQARFAYDSDDLDKLEWQESLNASMVKCVMCIISESEVQVRDLGVVPYFMPSRKPSARDGDSYYDDAYAWRSDHFDNGRWYPPYPPWDLQYPKNPNKLVSTVGANFNACTSASYEQLVAYPGSELTPAQLNDSYRAFAGGDIPVLAYNRSSAGMPNPTTDAGTFGEILGATVTGDVGSGSLDRTIERRPSPNARIPAPGPMYQLIAYDYHGGSYCQDRLAQLGLTL